MVFFQLFQTVRQRLQRGIELPGGIVLFHPARQARDGVLQAAQPVFLFRARQKRFQSCDGIFQPVDSLLMLGLVLGDLLDKSFRRGLVLSGGELDPFFTRPISAVLAVIVIFTLVMSIPAANTAIRRAVSGIFRRRAA
jgi:hypothetical protein